MGHPLLAPLRRCALCLFRGHLRRGSRIFSAGAPDLWGRYYDPKNPQYGPPHASSTGVYLEGLADALKLARACGDETRATAYERAVWRSVRALRQLQFKDDVDAFYATQGDKVMGGLRTETYNNEIRVDNVQHGLMGLLKLTRILDIPFDG